MKKTFTANLNGTVFHIEEDAYDQLQRYLANIRAKFSGSSEAEEIMADIEARIAELFTERLHGREAVSMADVDHVKQVMGQPEDYVDGEADEGADQTEGRAYQHRSRHKRLFRNPDDRWIGGVLSGVAIYFGQNPLWFRIAFIVILIGGWGSPVLLYLVMWALVPEAVTAAEKLEMHGEPVTVDNIKRMFEEGSERVKAGAEKVASEARDMGSRYKQQGYSAVRHTESLGYRLLNVLGKLLGIVLLFVSIIVGLTLISALVGSTAGWNNSSFTGGTGLMGLAGFIFPDAPSSILFTLSALALCLIPVLMLFLGSLWLLFRVRTPRWLGWSLTVAFIVALALATWAGIRLGMDFNNRAEQSTPTTLPAPANGLLTVKVRNASGYTEYHSWGYVNGRFYMNSNLLDLTGDSVHFNISHLNVELSPDSSFHLVSKRLARGGSQQEAHVRAGHISNSFAWQDDTLSLSSRFSFPKGDRMRAQQVRYVLQVPMGGRVHFMRGTERLMVDWFDMDDFGSNLERDMVGKTLIMTPGGLQDEEAVSPTADEEEDDGPVAFRIGPTMPNLLHLLSSFVRI